MLLTRRICFILELASIFPPYTKAVNPSKGVFFRREIESPSTSKVVSKLVEPSVLDLSQSLKSQSSCWVVNPAFDACTPLEKGASYGGSDASSVTRFAQRRCLELGSRCGGFIFKHRVAEGNARYSATFCVADSFVASNSTLGIAHKLTTCHCSQLRRKASSCEASKAVMMPGGDSSCYNHCLSKSWCTHFISGTPNASGVALCAVASSTILCQETQDGPMKLYELDRTCLGQEVPDENGWLKISNGTSGRSSNCQKLGCRRSVDLQGCQAHCRSDPSCNAINFCVAGSSCEALVDVGHCCPLQCSGDSTGTDLQIGEDIKGWDVHLFNGGVASRSSSFHATHSTARATRGLLEGARGSPTEYTSPIVTKVVKGFMIIRTTFVDTFTQTASQADLASVISDVLVDIASDGTASFNVEVRNVTLVESSPLWTQESLAEARNYILVLFTMGAGHLQRLVGTPLAYLIALKYQLQHPTPLLGLSSFRVRLVSFNGHMWTPKLYPSSIFLRLEVNYKYDGDEQVLYRELKNLMARGGNSSHDIIAEMTDVNVRFERDSQQIPIAILISILPLPSISVDEAIETLNANTCIDGIAQQSLSQFSLTITSAQHATEISPPSDVLIGWQLKHPGMFCDAASQKSFGGSGSGLSVQQCKNLVALNEDCSDVMQSNGDECACVMKGKDCVAHPSSRFNNIYKLDEISFHHLDVAGLEAFHDENLFAGREVAIGSFTLVGISPTEFFKVKGLPSFICYYSTQKLMNARFDLPLRNCDVSVSDSREPGSVAGVGQNSTTLVSVVLLPFGQIRAATIAETLTSKTFLPFFDTLKSVVNYTLGNAVSLRMEGDLNTPMHSVVDLSWAFPEQWKSCLQTDASPSSLGLPHDPVETIPLLPPTPQPTPAPPTTEPSNPPPKDPTPIAPVQIGDTDLTVAPVPTQSTVTEAPTELPTTPSPTLPREALAVASQDAYVGEANNSPAIPIVVIVICTIVGTVVLVLSAFCVVRGLNAETTGRLTLSQINKLLGISKSKKKDSLKESTPSEEVQREDVPGEQGQGDQGQAGVLDLNA